MGQDGTISFLEVNTRLQVEHPVSEEVTGLDLVREMFRIAAGEELGYDDPVVDGHSIEFRINAEDGGNNFMPAPGTLSRWEPPSGPGVRVDGGYVAGETIPGAFDSLIAKVIVTGRDRTQALERSRRALAEFVVDGMPTVVPFHRAVVDDPAYIGEGSDTDGPLRRLHLVDRDRVRQPDHAVRRRPRPRAPTPRSARPSSSRSAVVGSRSRSRAGSGRSPPPARPEGRRSRSDRPARRPAPRPAATP